MITRTFLEMLRPVHSLLFHRSRGFLPISPTPVSPEDNAHIAVDQHKVVRINGNVLAAHIFISFRIPVRPFARIQCHKTDELRLVEITYMADYLGFRHPVRPVVAEQVGSVRKRMADILPQINHREAGIIDNAYRRSFHGFTELCLLLATQRLAEPGAASVDKTLVPYDYFSETPLSATHRQTHPFLQRVAQFAEKEVLHLEVPLKIDIRTRSSVLAGLAHIAAPIFSPKPSREQCYYMVNADRRGQCPGMSVEKEAIGDGYGVAEEQ